MRDRDLWLFDLRMPLLLPLEAVIASVAAGGQHFHGLLDRDFSASCQHVSAVFLIAFRRARVFQMRVADVAAELPERLGRRFPCYAGVMRVPEKSHVRMSGAPDDFEQRRRSHEFAM